LSNSSGDAAEAAVVATFGYKQEFERVIGGFASFALSFSNASVTTGTFLAIAGIFAIAGGAGVWVFLVNAVLMLFVGLVYATLAARFPLAGLEYQWGTRLTNPWVGSMLGWLAFGVVTVSTVAVDYVLASTVLPALFAYTSGSGLTVVVTAIILLAQCALLALSTKLTSRVNTVVVVSELVLVIGLVILLVVVGGIRGMWVPHNLISEGAAAGPRYFSLGGLSTVGAFWLLISISFFSISDGFQGCANVAEETKDAQRVVPRAMMQTLIYTAGIQMLIMIALILVSHHVAALATSSTAMASIVTAVLGAILTKIFLVIAVFNVFACGLVVFLQMTRYTWAMARDNRFPAARYFRDVHPRFETPLRVTILCLILLLAVLLFFGFNSASFNNLIAAGGLCAVVVYLFVMVIYALAGRRIPLPEGRFGLGRWEWPVIAIAILWLVFALAIFRAGFASAWEYFGGMVVLGIIYVVYAVGVRRSEIEPGAAEAGS
jgi:amino acid transporter